MKKVRWGIIGCGNVTEVKSGPAFNKIDNSELVAVMRRNGAKAKDYAERHGVPKWYDNAEALIHDPEVDVVYIATPPDSHAAYTLQVAAAGKPVYVEKPMALNYVECQEMITACEQAGVPLFVAFYRRSQPAFNKVKELLESKAIGDVRFVNIKLYQPLQPEQYQGSMPWRVQPEISGGGLFHDLAPHQLDILDYILGPIASASGQVTNQAGLYEAEDLVMAQFRFGSGVLGSGVWCYSVAEQQQQDCIEIVGSAGRITFPTFAKEPIRLETAAGTEEFLLPPPQHVQQPFIQSIVEELTGKGKCPGSAVSAARTSRVMDQIVGRE
ncbi:Gfo/Idh/MocA family protein [Pontibacter anaerobius]|uniref:Gfo/Idh/MocA family oxidoreductase n=1 Tax=Pontibacter anaerobius TaxID=2993940 RepID=A0ABT3RDS6_9BACT|nr:Gfo/Idh/MocA family oxidoreductase [Pontibacter anaerobius]MCX2739581.1 Gfo/Idh/MocA family oxidoreductase [Pontibacter anaerobius]